MGHEYVELKNTHAAIESYRRAVDVNRRDYRAWYGLGQTYEVLEMHAYALWYYKRAAGLRPWDGKMWMAVGSCLQKLGRDYEGIKALKRALFADSYYDGGVGSSFGGGARGGKMGGMDPEVLLQIAGMYERMGEEAEAREYMELCIAQEEGLSSSSPSSPPPPGLPLNASFSASTATNPQRRRSDGTDDIDDDDVRNGYDGRIGGNGYGNGYEDGNSGNGTGVTAATSKARMWLARYMMRTGEFGTAMKLAGELCQDGVEVEEAKALIREVRARQGADGGEG
jgi:anaphase-promoting complex subunit 8